MGGWGYHPKYLRNAKHPETLWVEPLRGDAHIYNHITKVAMPSLISRDYISIYWRLWHQVALYMGNGNLK